MWPGVERVLDARVRGLPRFPAWDHTAEQRTIGERTDETAGRFPRGGRDDGSGREGSNAPIPVRSWPKVLG